MTTKYLRLFQMADSQSLKARETTLKWQLLVSHQLKCKDQSALLKRCLLYLKVKMRLMKYLVSFLFLSSFTEEKASSGQPDVKKKVSKGNIFKRLMSPNHKLRDKLLNQNIEKSRYYDTLR